MSGICLLHFMHGDAPAAGVPVSFQRNAHGFVLRADTKKGTAVEWTAPKEVAATSTVGAAAPGAAAAASPATAGATTGRYVAVLDDGTVLPIREVIPVQRVRATAPAAGGFNLPLSGVKIGAQHVHGVDFRTQKGQDMEEKRKEYGRTSATAKNKPSQILTNDALAEQMKKKGAAVRRQRDEVVERVDGTAEAPAAAAAAEEGATPAAVKPRGSKKDKEAKK